MYKRFERTPCCLHYSKQLQKIQDCLCTTHHRPACTKILENVYLVHYKTNHTSAFYSTRNFSCANFCIVGKTGKSTVIPKPQQTRPGKRLATRGEYRMECFSFDANSATSRKRGNVDFEHSIPANSWSDEAEKHKHVFSDARQHAEKGIAEPRERIKYAR